MDPVIDYAEMSDAVFVLVGYGDGCGTEIVRGFEALRPKLLKECGVDLFDDWVREDWMWSHCTPPKPYSLQLSFEDGALTIIRLEDQTLDALRAVLSQKDETQ